ncbi:hypothetical protein EJ08DRAFT_598909 [Tothia fuscella]|uniref:Sodium/calcium exchanger membrane region domain-containing protein n=1 Tax=Tothia fuscella TaxID=1048955 RepID=A0A9P4NFH5_9PEZI|nr:hypothetical protein EJ08DRAFT_598909 [Tothia fuscella]
MDPYPSFHPLKLSIPTVWKNAAKRLRALSFRFYVYLLFPLVPVGFVLYYTRQHLILIFVINLVAIFPSTSLLDYGPRPSGATLWRSRKSLALHDVWVWNTIQFITSIILLHSRQIVLLQISLVGGILSNMHLMLGLGFVACGFRGEQRYNATIAGTLGALLHLSMTGLIIPTASNLLAKPTPFGLVRQSRGTAVIFIPMYLALLVFQFKTHLYLSEEELSIDDYEERLQRKVIGIGPATAIIGVATTMLGFNTFSATNSLEDFMVATGLTKSFVGIILLPLMTNDLAAVDAGLKRNMNLCLQVTIGKCVQTAFFVTPIIVIIGWGMKIDNMTLNFDGFDVAALFASVL